MNAKEVHEQILILRAELDDLIKSKHLLTNPDIVAKSAEIDRLVVLYQRLAGQDSSVHIDGSLGTANATSGYSA